MNDPSPPHGRYWNTLRYLKPIQIANRAWRTIHRPGPAEIGSIELRQPIADWIEPAKAEPTMVGADEFEFLGVRRRISCASDWTEPSIPLLWRYHLHYFDDLNALSSLERAGWHQSLIERWIEDNPPLAGAGWDPFPTSLRIVNWIKWQMGGARLSDRALQSLRIQLARVAARLEYHLLGNHLLENARALVFGGLFFSDEQADNWLGRGTRILEQQLPEQILKDGGHFERSPMYHQLVLAGLLDLHNIMQTFGRSDHLGIVQRIHGMVRWSSAMRHPDGDIALFNDSAFGEGPSPSSLDAYAHRLGIGASPKEEPPCCVHLSESGFARVARDGYVAMLNIGSVAPAYQPGHAHADTLSFELSCGGHRLFVDTGTSTYQAGPRRSQERSTSAHNSVVINGQNSSEVWGTFRVARRASVIDATLSAQSSRTTVTASHNGYRRLRNRATHTRRWQFSDADLIIEDSIEGIGEAELELCLNVHPDWQVMQLSDVRFAIKGHDRAEEIWIDTPPEMAARVGEFMFAPRFGSLHAGRRLVASGRFELPKRFSTIVRFALKSI